MNNLPDFLQGATPVNSSTALPDFLEGATPVQSEESFAKSAVRTAVQLPLGYASKYTAPIDLATLATQGAAREALSESEAMQEARQLYPQNNFPAPLTEEQKNPYIKEIGQYAPTQGNIEKLIEEKTGIPLTAQTKAQKALRLGGNAAGFKAGSLLEKGGAAVVAPTVSTYLQDKGLNPELADFIGILASGGIKEQKPNASNPIPGRPDVIVETPNAGGGFGSPPPPPGSPPGGSRTGKPSLGAKPAEKLQSILNAGQEFSSEHELGQQVQKALTPKSANVPTPNVPVKTAPPISKKVIPSDKKLGIIPVSPQIKTAENEIGKTIAPGKFKNTTQGGQTVVSKIRAKDARIYKDVRTAYKEAENANKHLTDIHPELVEKLNTRLEELNEIKDKLKSGPQKELATSIDELLDTLAYRETNGRITGFRPINNQTLINIAQSQGQKVDFDFANGQPKNIFRPFIAQIKESAKMTASKDPKALKLLNEADKKYGAWADKFDNDYMRPFRDKSNKDFSKLYKGAQDVDEFNMIRNVLEDSKGGKNISNTILRDFVEQKLSPHIKSGNAKAFEKQLNELEAVISPAQKTKIRDIYFEKSPLRLKNIKQEVKSSLLKNKLPEDISRKADTISGIKDLEKELLQINERALIDRIKKFKAADLILKGKLNPSDPAKSLREILKDRESLAYLVETIGRENVNELIKLADELAKSGKLAKIGEKLIDVVKTLSGSKKEAVFKILKKVFTEENIDRMMG